MATKKQLDLDGTDFEYLNRPADRDLLNYMEMDITQRLWANTGTGWMSVIGAIIVGLAIISLCLIAAGALMLLRGLV